MLDVRVALLIARSRLRRNVGATLALIVLAGLGGALVMASLASIRRAEAGWDALRADTPAADAVATVMTEDFQFPSPAVDDLAGLQAEVDAPTRRRADDAPLDDRRRGVHVRIGGSSPGGRGSSPSTHRSRGSWAIRSSWRAARPTPPAPMRPRSTRRWLRRSPSGWGDTITVTPLTTAQLGELEAGVELDAAGTPTEVRVVGVTRAPIDVLPREDSSRATTTATFRLMPAWYRQHGPDLAAYGVMLGIDLAEGPGAIDDVAEALAAEYGERSLVVPGVEFDLGVTDEMQRAVEDRLRAEGRAQLAFAAVAALVAVVIFGQTLARQIATESSDVEALAALGLTRGDRTLAHDPAVGQRGAGWGSPRRRAGRGPVRVPSTRESGAACNGTPGWRSTAGSSASGSSRWVASCWRWPPSARGGSVLCATGPRRGGSRWRIASRRQGRAW